MTIGPVVDNRFYYDFDIEGTFFDGLKIEKEMHVISKQNYEVAEKIFLEKRPLKYLPILKNIIELKLLMKLMIAIAFQLICKVILLTCVGGPHVPIQVD